MVIHEVLTGKNEIKGAHMRDTVFRALTHELTRLDAIRDDVSRSLADSVARALSKEPQNRFNSAQAIAEELRRIRTVSETEAIQQLAEHAARDLRDPRLAEILNVPGLADLEAAWREEAGDAPLDSEPPYMIASVSETPTVIGRTNPRPTATQDPDSTKAGGRADRESGRKRPMLPWIAGGAALLGIMGLALPFFLEQSKPPPADDQPFILVSPYAQPDDPPVAEGNVPANADVNVDEGVDARGDAAVGPEDPGPRTRRRAPPTPQMRTALLTRAFSKKQGAIQACFSSHAASVTGHPQIAVRFTIAASGVVETVRVVPAALGASPLGQCILRISRITRFPSQPSVTTFSIPITARRSSR